MTYNLPQPTPRRQPMEVCEALRLESDRLDTFIDLEEDQPAARHRANSLYRETLQLRIRRQQDAENE